MFVQPPFRGQFVVVAGYEQLGESWQGAGGPKAIRRLYTDGLGTRALFLMHGENVPALWFDLAQGREPVELTLDVLPACVNVERRITYTLGKNTNGGPTTLLSRQLPEGAWETILTPDVPRWNGNKLLAVACHPVSEVVWVAAVGSQPSPVGGETGDDTTAPTPPALDTGITTCRILPNRAVETVESVLPLASAQDVQLAPLARGSALIAIGHEVYYLSPALDEAEACYSVPAGRDFELLADSMEESIGWIYLKPRTGGAGTGRTAGDSLPGALITFDTAGRELARVTVGAVPMGQIVGDWQRRRCLLAQPAVGVAVADLMEMQVSWPLRQGGETPLHLLPSGRRIWSLLPDAIVGIATEDLIELGPELAASAALSVELAAEVKPAAEALGWDWQATQLSPLLSQTGRLTLFNTEDPDSSWAEFDWSPVNGHASKLLIARVPTAADLAQRPATTDEVSAYCRSLLTALGWPEAERDAGRGTHNQLELQIFYTLDPGAEPPLDSGEFRLWITDQATVMTLEAATTPLPAGSLSIPVARALAAEAVVRQLGQDTVSLANLAVARMPQAGWVDVEQPGPIILAPEAEKDAAPCLKVETITSGAEPCLYSVYLNALSEEVLQLSEEPYSPLAVLRHPSSYFGPTGEFAPGGPPEG